MNPLTEYARAFFRGLGYDTARRFMRWLCGR